MENNALRYLRPDDVPESFILCFNSQCPHRAECTRYVTGPVAHLNRDHGPAVFPSALKADGKCRFFLQLRIIRAAWGFRPLFRKVRHEDYATLRWQVKMLFGSERNFYRYNRGEHKLTPERQEEVMAVFRQHGYDTTDLRFEHYEEQVDFIGQ